MLRAIFLLYLKANGGAIVDTFNFPKLSRYVNSTVIRNEVSPFLNLTCLILYGGQDRGYEYMMGIT